MKRQLTLAEYRTVDLTILAVILAVLEYGMTLAARRWYPEQLYTVSLSSALCAIVLMRWGIWAGFHAMLGGAVFWYASGGTWQQLLIYGIGNLAALLVLPLLGRGGKEKIRRDKLLTAVFALAVTLAMQLGRAVMALLLGTSPGTCVGFFTTDALSSVFAMVVVSLAARLDGVFEDQKQYLCRLQEQQKKEKGGF